MSEASSLRSAAPCTHVSLAERGNRRAKPVRVMANLPRGVFRNERHANRLHSQLLERVQLECAGHDRVRMPGRIGRAEVLRHRAGVVYDVVEELRVEMPFDREQMLEDAVVVSLARL